MRTFTLGIMLSSMIVTPSFAEEANTTEVVAEPESVCGQLDSSTIAEFRNALKGGDFEAMTSLQRINSFWRERGSLACENSVTFVAELGKIAAAEYGVTFNIEEGVTPEKMVVCHAILDSFKKSYTKGNNPDHGSVAPDADAFLGMASSDVLDRSYAGLGCHELLGKETMAKEKLKIYTQSKARAKAKELENI